MGKVLLGEIRTIFILVVSILLFGCQNKNDLHKNERLSDDLFTVPTKYNSYMVGKYNEAVELSISVRGNKKYFCQKYNKKEDCFDLQYRSGFSHNNILLKIRAIDFKNYSNVKSFYIRWSLENSILHDNFNVDGYKTFINMDTIYTNIDKEKFKTIYPEFKGIIIAEIVDSIDINTDLFDSVSKLVGEEVNVNIIK